MADVEGVEGGVSRRGQRGRVLHLLVLVRRLGGRGADPVVVFLVGVVLLFYVLLSSLLVLTRSLFLLFFCFRLLSLFFINVLFSFFCLISFLLCFSFFPVSNSNFSALVSFGIRDGSYVVGDVTSDEVLDNANPFRDLISGAGWLVRAGVNHVEASARDGHMDILRGGSGGSSGEEGEVEAGEGEGGRGGEGLGDVLTDKLARTAIGHDAEGRLILLQVRLGWAGWGWVWGGGDKQVYAGFRLWVKITAPISPQSLLCSSVTSYAAVKHTLCGSTTTLCSRTCIKQ